MTKSKCTSENEKLVCSEFEKALGSDVSNVNFEKAYRKFALQNHPDKLPKDLLESEKNEKIENFKRIKEIYDDCLNESKKSNRKLCDFKNKVFKLTKKKANCVRRVSNWSTIKKHHKFENQAFNKDTVLQDLEKYSPKLKILIENIQKLDENDMKESNKKFKHVIYSDVKQMGHGVKIIASVLKSFGYEPCFKLDKNTIEVFPSKEKGKGFGMMVSTPLFGKNFTVKNKKRIQEIYNERPTNIHGDSMRIILIDNGFKEGIDLFDVKYMHIYEPQTTVADFRQAMGRATRFCGQKGLKFVPNKGWKLDVFTYNVIHEKIDKETVNLHDVFMKNSGLNLENIKLQEEIEKIAIESAVDYDLNYNVNKFSFQGDGDEDDNKKRLLIKGGATKYQKMSSKVDCDKDKFSPSGSRSNKHVPFSLNQLELIYKTFNKGNIIKLPQDYKNLSTKEKRTFFSDLLKFNKEFCERIVQFMKDTRFSSLNEKTIFSKSDLSKLRKYFNEEPEKNQNTKQLLLLENEPKQNNKSSSPSPSPSPSSSPSPSPSSSPSSTPSSTPSSPPSPSVDLNNQLVLASNNTDNSQVKSLEIITEDNFEDRKNETFEEFRKRINREFAQFKYEKIVIENLCGVSQDSSRIVEFTPSQNFISHYFEPKNDEKGLLVWHSVGTGKTCTAVATKSRTWERQGYTILWVTRTTLRNDIWKNMFQKVCDYLIAQKIKDGEDVPEDLFKQKMGKIKKYLSINFLEPISFKQFSNVCKKINSKAKPDKNKKNTFYHLVERNGNYDPLKKTLIIIDEAHKMLSKDLVGQEKPDFPSIQNAIFNSYEVSKNDSCRTLLMTATPFLDDPIDFFKMFNLVIGNEKERIPIEKYKEYLKVSDTLEIPNEGIKKLQSAFQGRISFLDRRFDPRQFTQPVFHKIEAKLSVPDDTIENEIQKCSEEYTKEINICDITKDENIQRGLANNQSLYDKFLAESQKLEKEMNDDVQAFMSLINDETMEMEKVLSNSSKKGQEYKQLKEKYLGMIGEFKVRLKKAKKNLQDLKIKMMKAEKDYQSSKQKFIKLETKNHEKCVKNAETSKMRCIKNAKKSLEKINEDYQSEILKTKCGLQL